jgi:sulfur carrier protein ThiS
LLTGGGLREIIYHMIRVVIDREEHQLNKKKMRIEILLKRFHINPETALALRQGELLTEDEDLLAGDVCIIMRTTAER